MKITGKVCVFLALGFLLRAGVVFGYTGTSSEALDSYLAQLRNVSFEEEPLPHYKGLDKDLQLYVFQSSRLQTSAFGFAGPLDLIIVICADELIQEVIIEYSQETPRYLKKIEPWLARFKEKPLLDFILPDVPIDTVTHATHSSAAIIETVSDSARLIVRSFFKQEAGEALPKKISGLKEAIVLVLFGFLGIFLFHKSQSKKIRYIFLVFLVLVFGFWFNLQFSFSQIASLLSLSFPPIRQASLLVLIFIPLILGFFYGRIYCGWLCPFGALQEILSFLGRPIKVPKKIERTGSYCKYIILFILVFLYFFRKNISIADQDPLGRAFFLDGFFALDNFLVWISLFFSLFIVRFWCRYFCVAGAFLSLLNKVALFKFAFKKNFSRCPWHVDRLRDLNCLLCNKCKNH